MVSANHIHSVIRAICIIWLICITVIAFQLLDSTGKYNSYSSYLTDLDKNSMTNFSTNNNKTRKKFSIKDLRGQISGLAYEQETLNLLLGDEAEEQEESDDALNPHPFKFLINEDDICNKKRPDIFFVIVVHTHPNNYKRRMHIRDPVVRCDRNSVGQIVRLKDCFMTAINQSPKELATWGNQRYYQMTRSVTIFAMGQSANAHTEKTIRVESSMYHDIIQENFYDSYKNLSLKGIMWLKWASRYCPNALYIVKVDDDIVVNIFNLARHLATLYNHGVSREKSILCLVWKGMPVLREQGSKWFVSKNEVENDTYPTYCSGSAYIITNDFVPVLYRQSFRTKFVWVDDAYITGFLPSGLEFEHVDLASLYVLRHEEIEAKLASGYALFGHSPTSVNSRIRLWKKIIAVRNIRL